MASGTAMRAQRLAGAVGATIEDVDLRQPLTAEAVDFIHQALLDHCVIFFRGQDIGTDRFWALMETFGAAQIEEYTNEAGHTADEVQDLDLTATRHSTARWHSDTTSMATPPKITGLRAISLPPFGGDTTWASMYAAFEALSAPMRAMLDGLTAVHSVEQTLGTFGDYLPYFEAAYFALHQRQQVHPVVITHPETGRKALYVNESYVIRILELSQAESDALLPVLFRHSIKPEYCVRWRWAQNDIALWDNRALIHYAVPDYTESRVMQRVVVAGAHPGEPSVGDRLAKAREPA